jgi:cytoskeletal protein CcmA (bactofilin family)
MWKDNRPTINPPQSSQPSQPSAAPAAASVVIPPKDAPKPAADRADVGHIGKSVVIRGELTGSEDLYFDGEIEGTINLRDHKLVIGPNSKIKAAITARDVVLHGKVEGNVTASERVELKRSCSLSGDISTQRISIEDGAFFKGAIDIKDDKEAKSDRKPMVQAVTMGGNSSSLGSSPTLSASAGGQGSFLEPK